jgi:hypothetical protein
MKEAYVDDQWKEDVVRRFAKAKSRIVDGEQQKRHMSKDESEEEVALALTRFRRGEIQNHRR